MPVAHTACHSVHSAFKSRSKCAQLTRVDSRHQTPDYKTSSSGSLLPTHKLCDYLLAHIHNSTPADHPKLIGHRPKLRMLDRTLGVSSLQPPSHCSRTLPNHTQTVIGAPNDVGGTRAHTSFDNHPEDPTIFGNRPSANDGLNRLPGISNTRPLPQLQDLTGDQQRQYPGQRMRKDNRSTLRDGTKPARTNEEGLRFSHWYDRKVKAEMSLVGPACIWIESVKCSRQTLSCSGAPWLMQHTALLRHPEVS